nr:diacylglycerol o-acyltransferase 2a [Quercus suber]
MSSTRHTPYASLSHIPRRKPVPAKPASATTTSPMATLNPEPADPLVRKEQHLPPKSYKDAAEEAVTTNGRGIVGDDGSAYDVGADEALNRDPAKTNDDVDEDSIKESPPRLSRLGRTGSTPRPLGEMMDEVEKIESPHSPGLRHIRGRLEEKSSRETYADTLSIPVSAFQSANGYRAGPAKDGTKTPEHFDGVGEDETPRSPVRKAHKVVSSKNLNPTEDRPRTPTQGKNVQASQSNDTVKNERGQDPLDESNHTASVKHLEQADEGRSLEKSAVSEEETTTRGADDHAHAEEEVAPDLVYENVFNKSGENLATIKASQDISLSMQQRVDQSSNAKSDAITARQRPSTRKGAESQLVSGRRAGSGWERSAIHWAPLSIPLQRRLQMLMVLLHTLSIVGFLALFFLLCAVPLLWPLLMPYLVYCLFSRASVSGELSHRSEWLRRSKIWSAFASYFPARLHRTQVLEPTRKYIFGYHPHGIISHGAFAAFATEALGFSQLFPGITNTLLTLDSNFRIPLYRDHALRLGLASVSRESCENLLSKGGPNGEGMGRAITIVIGGARESLDAKPYTLRLVLKRRKGFVKLAIRTGADLVPVLAFGENDIYDQVDAAGHPFVHKTQLLVKKFMGFTVPLFHARGSSNPFPSFATLTNPLAIQVSSTMTSASCHTADPSTSSSGDPYRSFRMLSRARNTSKKFMASTSRNSNGSGMTGERRLRRIAPTWSLPSNGSSALSL